MVIYDLACARGHAFEGWFQDLAAYQRQHDAKELVCPQCGSARVTKKVSGAAIKRSAEDRAGTAAPPPAEKQTVTVAKPAAAKTEQVATPTPEMVREFLGTLAAHVRANSEDVGERFADEAKKMHRGQAPERSIRGSATPSQEADLEAEGIPFLKLPNLSTDD